MIEAALLEGGTHVDSAIAVAQGGAQVVPARAQYGATLGFHIIPGLPSASPSLDRAAGRVIWLRRWNDTAMRLARRLVAAMGVLIAVARSPALCLSFEMGLAGGRLMRQYGSVLGGDRSPWRGCSSSVEAIFAGIYLWGWRRRAGLGALVVRGADRGQRDLRGDVGDCGQLVMNTPGGFTHANAARSPRLTCGKCSQAARRVYENAAHIPGRDMSRASGGASLSSVLWGRHPRFRR